MTMVSMPSAIHQLAPALPSPSLARAPKLASPAPSLALDGIDAVAIPPVLDCAVLTASRRAVNHLREARLRLLTAIPSVGIAWSLWCGRCGALREGFAGAECAPPTRPKRAADGTIKYDESIDAEEDAVEDELERELKRTLAAMGDTCARTVPATPPARTPIRRRRTQACTICGTKFRPPKPVPPRFAPARQVARTRRQSALAKEVAPAEEDKPRTLSPAGTIDAAELFEASSTSTPEPPTLGAALSRAPLAHISASAPETPTYPKPPVVPPPKSGGASLPVSCPTSPPPAKKRKTKKSGLAKLLAQNAQREAEKSGPGNWGLG